MRNATASSPGFPPESLKENHTMTLQRRAALALALTAAVWGGAHAQDKYPSRPVTLIVPQAAGGANDAIARVVAHKLTEQTGQSFIVENRPGAGGNIGTALAAKAKPDGYTLMLTTNSAHVINPALYKSTGFDPVKDFEPVGTVATAGYVLVANPSFPPKNVTELVTLAKSQPGKITIASAGNGTLNHLIGEMLGKATGIELVHVPYKGAAGAVTDLIGGQVQVSVQSLPSSLAFIKSGKLKVLGVSKATRMPLIGDVPTLAEQGLAGFESGTWQGLLVANGTPAAIINRLNTELIRIIRSPEIRAKLAGQGAEVVTMTPQQQDAFFNQERNRWAKVVNEASIKLD